MITYKEVDRTYFDLYDQVSMNVEVDSEYKLKRIDSLSRKRTYCVWKGSPIKRERNLHIHIAYAIIFL